MWASGGRKDRKGCRQPEENFRNLGKGIAWEVSAVKGMIQVSSRKSLAWIPSPKTRLWAEELHLGAFWHTERTDSLRGTKIGISHPNPRLWGILYISFLRAGDVASMRGQILTSPPTSGHDLSSRIAPRARADVCVQMYCMAVGKKLTPYHVNDKEIQSGRHLQARAEENLHVPSPGCARASTPRHTPCLPKLIQRSCGSGKNNWNE